MVAAVCEPGSPWPWVGLGWAAHIVTFGAVFLHCISRKRQGASALLWIFVAWSFPGIGPLLNLYLGIDRVPAKGFKKHMTDQKLLAERRAREEEALPLVYWRAVHDAAQGQPPSEFGLHLDRAMNGMLTELNLIPAGDEDWFSVDICLGDRLVVETWARRHNPWSDLDTYLELYDETGTVLVAENDDIATDTLDSRLDVTVSSGGTYYLRVYGPYAGDDIGQYDLDIQVFTGPANDGSSCRLPVSVTNGWTGAGMPKVPTSNQWLPQCGSTATRQ